jgi:hypothetical protein
VVRQQSARELHMRHAAPKVREERSAREEQRFLSLRRRFTRGRAILEVQRGANRAAFRNDDEHVAFGTKVLRERSACEAKRFLCRLPPGSPGREALTMSNAKRSTPHSGI